MALSNHSDTESLISYRLSEFFSELCNVCAYHDNIERFTEGTEEKQICVMCTNCLQSAPNTSIRASIKWTEQTISELPFGTVRTSSHITMEIAK